MKRFTETTKWDDPWFRKLSPKLKCLWQFIVDRCDPAGVIDIDCDLAGFQIGTKISEKDIRDLGGRVEKLDCGKWWVVRFVAFQYGKLSEDCKAHGPVFASLDAYSLKDRVSKGYAKGIHTLKDKDTDKDEDQDKDTEKDNPPAQPEFAIVAQKRKDRGTLDEIQSFCASLGLPPSDAEATFHKWEGNGWTNGGNPIKDWQATIRSWKAARLLPSLKAAGGTAPSRQAAADGRHYAEPTQPLKIL